MLVSAASIARALRAATAIPAIALAACATDDVTAAGPRAEGSFTVDASTGWVFVSLADSAVVTPTPSAAESPNWDLAFFATNVTLNGGQAGPGGVSGFCVCQNSAASPTAAEWLAQTADGEAADFEAVTAVPATATFVTDALTPAVTGWFSGTGAAAVAQPDSFHFVRLSDSSGVAKVRVASLENASASTAGRITLVYAVAANGAAAFGATQTATLDLTTGAKRFDFNTGQVTTSATDWELQYEGFTARVNGGVSGPGRAAAAKMSGAFTAAAPNATAANAFRTDVYAGVFGTSRFYQYNLGGDNRITPTFDVYLIRRGTAVYKLQITGYYGPTGQSRQVTFRYRQIAG